MIQTRICQEPSCGRSFDGGPRAYYCPDCRAERQRAAWRKYQSKKRVGKVDRPLGSKDNCERCGREYIVNAPLQRFCENCQLPHKLEHDYVRAKPKYEANKNRYNPARNERRRATPIPCRICGKLIQPRGKKALCGSEECRRENNRCWQREAAIRNRLRE